MSGPTEVSDKPPQSPADCKVCEDIWRRFADAESNHEINLGSFEDALSTQCPFHKPLVQSFIEYVRGPDNICEEPPSNDMGVTKGFKDHSVTIFESISKLGQFWNLLLVKKDTIPDHPGTGRVLDPDWADLDLLKKWKTECLSSHGAKCDNPMKIWPTRPAWLIDVERKCLVSGQVPGDFVALSYTYGNHDQFNVDADMLAQLQEPQALETPEMTKNLAPVIQHAVHLTSAIGERYLWADALCIPHVNPAVTAEQLKMMGAIYASAVVTIIAADDDCQVGLAGIKGVSSPRKMEQRVIPFGDEQIVVRNTGIFSMISGLPYYDRGWTYQEYKMSQRRILFNKNELHWECRCSVWHEELILGAEVDKYIDPRLGVILAGFPDLGSMNDVITGYNERKLRYEEDVLAAISGLLSVVSRSFEGGFLYGIPEMLFESGLGWRPHWDHTNLQRRVLSERSPENRLSPSHLPSWSWMGWQGLVTGGYGEAARINHRQYHIEETIPITEWYTSLYPTDPPSQRRRIRSTWFENRDSYKDFTKPLPPGWTRHTAPTTGTFRGEPHLYPSGCGKYIFTHTAMNDPDEEMRAWYYPFPVTDIQESTPPFTPEQTPYLFCETKAARLFGHQADTGNIVVLCNHLKEDIGSLHLHNEESLAPFPKTVAEGETGLPVELVAVYKSKRYSKTWNKEKQAYDLPLREEEKYVVLWIEWKSGVAFRLASGQVNAADWEKLDLEEVSLVLG
ncbi:heterokaryon incompatibility protein-domain-containing protein [Thelonectria olida]|uniref:Heterokaryon incompatibility protein-domain-containing protein n=1 Tax=Thelonectria olida TaxID=1576542 RepID=A0A9P8VV14_9HYPO|nr:heterokaryon incompatibility protein-domain-containing protein [Thelonectria olida]